MQLTVSWISCVPRGTSHLYDAVRIGRWQTGSTAKLYSGPRATWHQHSRSNFLPNSNWVLQPSPPTANTEDKARKKKERGKGPGEQNPSTAASMAMSISGGCVGGDSGTLLAPSASSLRPPLRRAAGPKVWTPAPRPLNPSIYLVQSCLLEVELARVCGFRWLGRPKSLPGDASVGCWKSAVRLLVVTLRSLWVPPMGGWGCLVSVWRMCEVHFCVDWYRLNVQVPVSNREWRN